MKAKLIEVIQDKCTGCRLCEMACSLHHEQECSTTKSRIKIVRDEEFGNHLVLACTQCAEAYCAESCPMEALRRDEETSAVLVDEELCNGCEACVAACPIDAITLDNDKNIISKCDLCGGDPECVKWCSREAIVVKEDDISSSERKSTMEKTSRLLLNTQGVDQSSA